MLAILLATAPAQDGSPAALLAVDATPALARLTRQLYDTSITRVLVLTRAEWGHTVAAALPDGIPAEVRAVASTADALSTVAAVAGEGDEPLLLGHADIVTQQEVLAGLLRDPRLASGILSSAARPQGIPLLRVRIDRGRVTAAESAYHSVHKPTSYFLGLVKVTGEERRRMSRVAAHLAELTLSDLPAGWEAERSRKIAAWSEVDAQLDVEHAAAVAADDLVALVLTGLCREGAALTSADLRDLFWVRPLSQERAATLAAVMSGFDEEKALLNSAVKASDGFFTTFFVSPYSKYLARWCARRGFTPNQVTVASMLLGVVAAAGFATGTRAGLVLGAVALQLAFTADCVDGQLARYSRQFSKLGAWLDSVFDRGKEYLVFAGLALGATRAGDDGFVWLLASVALALQTTRHAIDFSWGLGQQRSIAGSIAAPMTSPAERADIAEAVAPEVRARRGGTLSSLGNVGLSASHFFEQRSWMKWAKRILVLPIGERFVLISITAAFWDARTTFGALLVWGGVALLYSLTGRILRTVA